MSRSSEPAAAVERIVVLPKALHARPAGQVAQAATRLDSQITLGVGERQIDARSVLAVMGLGAVAGTAVRVGGSNADAVDEIARILSEPEA
jgi:phosphotransferase system HPr (HPr) family protein